MDNDKAAGTTEGECNNQIEVEYVRGERAVDGTQEGAIEDARQVGGGQRDKREEGEHETSRWQAIKGDWAANNMTRGGGRRTLCKAMGQWVTQREARGDNAGQLDKAGVDDARRSDGGQHKERRGVEDPTGGGPDMAVDDTSRGGEQRTRCGGRCHNNQQRQGDCSKDGVQFYCHLHPTCNVC